jgi:hypothetical protein
LRAVCAGAAMLAIAGTCTDATGPLPDNSERFEPPLVYRIWWQQVETCAGRLAPFETVSWYIVRTTDYGFEYRGQYVVGVWTSPGNRILLAEHFVNKPMVVRHEMLHAVLRSGSHPEEYFGERCRSWVDQSY